MKSARIALALAGIWGAVLAQNTPSGNVPAVLSAAAREARHRLDLAGTRAVAYFHSLDSIEVNLRDLGLALNPQLVSLRLRIESALNGAEDAIAQNDLAAANEALDQAEALLARLASKLGG